MKTAGIPSFEERVNAIEHLGYTRREAEFLVLAALHSGYFLRRQFSAAGKGKRCALPQIALHGVTASLPTPPATRTCITSAENHCFGHWVRSITGIVGITNPSTCATRSCCWTTCLATRRGPQFLATEEDKVEYFCNVRGLNTSVLPSKEYVGRNGSKTTRYFVDKFPVRVDQGSGAVSFGFIDDGISKAGFRTWLTQIQSSYRGSGIGRNRIRFSLCGCSCASSARV